MISHKTLIMPVSCPNCGAVSNIDKKKCGKCNTCQCPWILEKNILTWGDGEKTNPIQKWKHYCKKLKNQLNPISSIFLPFRYITNARVEKYYQRTLHDQSLAKKWATHYLKDINLKPGDLVLDHGCGRGRFTALASQNDFITLGQEITKHSWWQKIDNASFQVVPPHFVKLPWRDQTFAAIFSFGVLHYINEEKLSDHILEIFRILKPGGYCIILEANDKGYAASLIRKQIGRLHSLTTLRRLFQNLNFKELSLTYEGFYAPIFPLFINFLRKQCSLKSFDISDYNTKLESIIPPERRGFWFLKIQKPDDLNPQK